MHENFLCHALYLIPTEHSHLTNDFGEHDSYWTLRESYESPNNSSLLAIDLVMSCLKPITNCCILLFFCTL